MSETETRLDRKRTKELKVLELYDKGYSYRKIASLVRVSLRDVAKCIHRISNKRKSPSTASVHDEIVLEYTVNRLRCEVRDLKIERDRLMKEVNDLCAQKFNLQIQVRSRQTELGAMKRNLEDEKYWKKFLNDIPIEGR